MLRIVVGSKTPPPLGKKLDPPLQRGGGVFNFGTLLMMDDVFTAAFSNFGTFSKTVTNSHIFTVFLQFDGLLIAYHYFVES